MKKFLLSLISLIVIAGCTSVDTAPATDASFPRASSASEQKAILRTIDTFLIGWFEGDTDMMKSAISGPGEARIGRGLGQNYLDMTSTSLRNLADIAPRTPLTELYWAPRISLFTDYIAVARLPSAHYRGTDLNYCAMSIYLLSKEEDGWRILDFTQTYDHAALEAMNFDKEAQCRGYGFEEADRRPFQLEQELN